MSLNNNRFGYDPDEYDDEPSDYVNSDTAYDADALSKDDAEEEQDDLLDEDDELDEQEDADLVEDDLIEEDVDLEDDELDDTDVEEEDVINDDNEEYTAPAAELNERKPVYIKDMPYIDHAMPGVTSN